MVLSPKMKAQRSALRTATRSYRRRKAKMKHVREYEVMAGENKRAALTLAQGKAKREKKNQERHHRKMNGEHTRKYKLTEISE